MNEFWIWFWRPIAELLGTLALIVGVVFLAGAVVAMFVLIEVLKEKIKERTK